MVCFCSLRVVALVLALVVGLAALAQGFPIPEVLGPHMATAFTYQGVLTGPGGVAATGEYDLICTLHDAPVGDTQVGPTIERPHVAVTAGRFAVSLNFGAYVFTGAPRWLEILVRPTGTLDYTTLTPRQALSPTPYALTALTVAPGSVAEASLTPELAARLAGLPTPVALGTFDASGVKLSGSANLRCTKVASTYELTLDGETIADTTHTCFATSHSSRAFATVTAPAGFLRVTLRTVTGGVPTSDPFSVMIYRTPTAPYTAGGQVRDMAGNPVVGVTLTIATPYGTWTAHTDGTGTWRCTEVLGSGTVTPSKVGLGFAPTKLNIAGPAENLAFTACVGYTVSGTVGSEQSGCSPTAAQITFTGDVPVAAVTANGIGQWERTGLVGAYTATVAADGWTFVPNTIAITGPATDLRFAGTFRSAGTVKLGATNTGVPGITMTCNRVAGPVMTGADGSYAFDGLPGTSSIVPSGAGWAFTPTFESVSGITPRVFRATFTLSGAVRGLDGAPMAGVTVTASNGATATTDAAGVWSIAGIGVPVTVAAAKTGYTFTTIARTFSAPDSVVDFDGTYTLTGRVVDGANTGVAGVAVRFVGATSVPSVLTDADGNWTRPGLRGPVTVSADLQGWTFTGGGAATGPATMIFAGTFTIAGTVRDGAGNPVAGLVVTESHNYRTATTDAAGRWSMSGIARRDCRVYTGDAGGRYYVTPYDLSVVGPSSSLDFMALPWYTVEGKVTNAAGQALPAGVTAIYNAPATFAGTRTDAVTDAAGLFRLRICGTGTLTSSAGPAYSFAPASLTVSEATQEANFVGGYTATGIIMQPDGMPAAGVTVNFTGGFPSVTTDANGVWRRTGLSGTVMASPAAGEFDYFTPASRTLQDNGMAAVGNFTAFKPYTVSGTVIVPGTPPTGLPMVEMRFSDGSPSVYTDAQGAWSKSGLYGGVTITPVQPGASFTPPSFTVTRPETTVVFQRN